MLHALSTSLSGVSVAWSAAYCWSAFVRSKVWVQRDRTEDGVTYELEAAGIPKDKIVLAFHPEDIRQYTGYALA